MRIVKATPKKVEDLPEWARCCNNYIQAILDFGELLVDTSTIEKRSYLGCFWCRSARPQTQNMILDINDQTMVPLDCLELDEGIYSESL